MVWVVVPVAVRAKSELPDGPVPTVMSCGGGDAGPEVGGSDEECGEGV